MGGGCDRERTDEEREIDRLRKALRIQLAATGEAIRERDTALARVDVLQKRERRMLDGFRAEIDRIQEALGIGPTRSVLWCVAEIGRLRARPHFVPVCRDCGAEVERGQCCKAKGCPPYPLAALRAAEERLLDAHGWKPGDPGFWIDPTDGTQWPREGAIAAVRRRPEPGAKDGNKQ